MHFFSLQTLYLELQPLPCKACHSFHHQAIDSLGHGFVVSGVATDGTVEAIESTTATWCVAVQWHPEDSAAEDQQQQNLFDALIASIK